VRCGVDMTLICHYDPHNASVGNPPPRRVVGDCPELGDWHPMEGAKLRTSSNAFPYWHLGSSWIILDHLGSSWIILATLSPERSATIPTLSWSKDRGVVSCRVNVLEPSPQVVPGGMISCIPHCTSVCHTVTVYARLP